ncbi:right-handed parallel beta-helix repeat-containing protein [Streptomyces rugosispiralis]|uniref:Right-handed parallel beta-helix repeat-containing protein n=1 Tax=Streptomyces rugosispiralis TaxID=2967341 RepID=A0ABT1UV88_9ACTN|nr:right-handed parallel beta-helix repeat-containing protein [Streptomyces rugosispiralis]MCQ8189033.1 right-handed parallel beta-helix repeat-containing protein [Streptomyces rugosispiralis]
MRLRRKRGRHRRRKDRTLPLGSAVIVASAVAGVYLTASPEGASAVPTTLYVATNGSDGNTGTLKSPYRSLEKAFSIAKAGTTIEVRGGTYYPSRTLRSSTSGTPRERVQLRSYRAEKVRLDGSRLGDGSSLVSLAADYWTVSGIELRNAPGGGLVCTSCTRNVFQNLSTHGNGDTGLTLRGDDTNGNVIRNLDSYANHDDATGGQRADGIAITHGSGTGNVVTGSRLFHNSDDGLDLWMWASPVTIEHSWAFGNGRNRWHIPYFKGDGSGFQLGADRRTAPSPAHVVRSSAAWANTKSGFDAGGNTGALRLQRTTAFDNWDKGYAVAGSRAQLIRNLALSNGRGSADTGLLAVSRDNNWAPGGRATPPLVTTDATTTFGPRRPNGSLPLTGFLVVMDRTEIGSPMN